MRILLHGIRPFNEAMPCGWDSHDIGTFTDYVFIALELARPEFLL